jgi:hypothetical protein
MTDYGLSPQQLRVIDALSSGATMTHAAEQAGIHRNTLSNLRCNLLPFQHALAHAQYDRALLYREKLEDLADADIEKITVTKQTEPVTEEQFRSMPASLHNSAQSLRTVQPKIGRNEACPCGSGKKYKRCSKTTYERTDSANAASSTGRNSGRRNCARLK